MSRMTKRGQVTIPKRVQDHLGLKPDSQVELTLTNEGRIAGRTGEERPKTRFDELIGTLDLGMTTDEFIKMLQGDPDDDFG
jgi:antitoxin PrlF